jgi:uncharacterized protein (TIGR03086 family)
MTEISDRYRRLAAEFTRRVDAVNEDDWDNQSPCSDWTARGVVGHVVDTESKLPTWAGKDALSLQHSADDDPKAAWVEVRDQMQDLLEDPERAGIEYDGMFGHTTLEKTADQFLMFDLLVHGWDIARATGQDENLPADEVTRVYAMAQDLGDNLRRGGVCGPAVEVGEDASEQDRMLGLLGRTP